MTNENLYRIMNKFKLDEYPIVSIYNNLCNGKLKALPKGTWNNNINVIILVRYILEVKLQLTREEIPKISRQIVKEHKLFGALNRFKSVPKLIHFVYKNEYNNFNFARVPANYWKDSNNIKLRLEYYLDKNNLSIKDIPTMVTYDALVRWGLSNPLKRHGHSPYRLINALYPNRFHPYQFRKIPQRNTSNKAELKKQFLRMIDKERIIFKDVPFKVTQEMLNKYRFSGTLKYYNNSPSLLIMELFPNQFTKSDFKKTNRFWKNDENVKAAIFKLIKDNNIPHNNIPQTFTKKLLQENGLSGLLHEYKGSPIEIINKVFPNEFYITEFQRVPNKYWTMKENRINALRNYCKQNQISREGLPNLTRAYFRKNFPRFISIADRHYESKFYLWIMEAFPEYNFKLSEFNLYIGIDGQLCDSKEELLIHNYLCTTFKFAIIEREGKRFVNDNDEEIYIPDWIIKQNGEQFIIEYFGLYNSSRFPGYTKKADRKICFYNSLDDYKFISIMPEDLRRKGFKGIVNLLCDGGLLRETCIGT